MTWMRPGLLAVAASYTALQVLGRRAGSSAAERARRLPGDDLVDRPQIVTDHAQTISAPAAEVWPWLTQLGRHLGGYYTPGWVDRWLFPANWPSLDHLDPALLRSLEIGDTVPDGPPGTAEYVVVQVEAPHALVLRSTTHLPPGWGRAGARMTWTWSFALTDLPGGRCRLHLRVRGRTGPWWLTAVYVGAVVPADFVMATGMLRGIKRRVESGAAPMSSGRAPYVAGTGGAPTG
ncbi:MAG: SRPBCC family protein [Nocardioides sp.]